MVRFELHTTIQQIIEFLYRLGLWHRNEEETAGGRRLKLFYLIYYSTFPISLAAGAFKNDNHDEQIFLIESTATSIIMFIKLWYLMYRQKETFELLNGISNFCVDDRHTFNVIKSKLKMLTRFAVIFLCLSEFAIFSGILVVPFIGSDRVLFLPIGFPLDWRNDESAYWIAYIYISIQAGISGISLLFSVIVWYLVANCSWRYEVLGQEMKKLGEAQVLVDEPADRRKVSNTERDNFYLKDLDGAIKSANDLKKLTDQLQLLLSNFFAAEFTSSAMSICASVYCIAFVKGENIIEFIIYLAAMVYHIFDIFMITFYGNKIKLTTDKLSYCLFESNWVERPQPIKIKVLIFSEILAKPRELMVFKIYPLTLVTFSRIMNSAYSMLNLLKNFK